MHPDARRHYMFGVAWLDQEHNVIFDFLDEICSCKDKDTCIGMIERLAQFWILHFHHEEEFMQEIGFPYVAAHKVEHHNMRDKMCKIVESMRREAGKQGIKVWANQVEDIIREHIDHVDSQFAVYAIKVGRG